MTLFEPGTQARFVDGPIVHITQACIQQGGTVTYEVAWIKYHLRYSAWVTPSEIVPITGTGSRKIGFLTPAAQPSNVRPVTG